MSAFSDEELRREICIAKNGKMMKLAATGCWYERNAGSGLCRTTNGNIADGKYIEYDIWRPCRPRVDICGIGQTYSVGGAENPVTIIPSRLFHPGISQYPMIAWREGIMNAFAHRDSLDSGNGVHPPLV